MLALGIGLRNGTEGGPVSIESADVRHVLLAPISRTRVLLRPIGQRVRSVAFSLGLGLAVVGQLVAREIDGSRAAWAASGALFGAMLAAFYVGAAVVAHALRVPRWVASLALGRARLAWQAVVAWGSWTDDPPGWQRIGPGNLPGSVLFWGIRTAASTSLHWPLRSDSSEPHSASVVDCGCSRSSVVANSCRSCVSRPRCRTSAPWCCSAVRSAPSRSERTRGSRPASVTAPPRRQRHRRSRSGVRTRTAGPATPRFPTFVWRRGVAALSRLPASRLLRMAGLAAVAGASASLTITSSWLFLVALVGAVFLLGLEAVEPLAQEVDRPDLADAMPVPRGWLFAHHLVAPAGLLALTAMIGAAAATALQPDHTVASFALAIPVAWAGAIGAVVTTVRDAPEIPAHVHTTVTGADRGVENPFSMPEFSGFSNVGAGALPVLLSAVAAGPVAAMRVSPTRRRRAGRSSVWHCVSS